MPLTEASHVPSGYAGYVLLDHGARCDGAGDSSGGGRLIGPAIAIGSDVLSADCITVDIGGVEMEFVWIEPGHITYGHAAFCNDGGGVQCGIARMCCGDRPPAPIRDYRRG